MVLSVKIVKKKKQVDLASFLLLKKCEKFSGKSFLPFFYMLKKSKIWYNFKDYVVNLVYDLI